MVSIIIPSFNRADFLARAIRSVKHQSFHDWELLVIDDGSTDRSSDVVQGLLEERIRYLRVAHGGVSRARNIGISLARYPWLSFLDSDDEWSPTKLQRQIEALEEAPDYRIAYTNETWIRRGQRVNQKKRHHKYGGWIYHRCLPLCIISPSSVMLHRRLLEEVGLFDETLPVCEDYDLWLRVSARNPVFFLDEALITKYGGHDDQLSKSTWGMDAYRVRALEKMLESGKLTPSQRVLTARELVTKSEILLSGFQKRKHLSEADRYEKLIRKWIRKGSES
jgi:glycosyltransferase involved in cell wall biosynthesis